MIEKHGVQSGVCRAKRVKEEYRIGFDKGSYVQNVDLAVLSMLVDPIISKHDDKYHLLETLLCGRGWWERDLVFASQSCASLGADAKNMRL